VKLRRLERQLPWPQTVPPQQLRRWLVQQLEHEAPLLRWAITAVSVDPSGDRRLQVEAVVEG
jgi:hypothetical protein|tara:strand:- start:467 stop:652 length:186 start_codon:yes stop_codon:yes gene_type:complete